MKTECLVPQSRAKVKFRYTHLPTKKKNHFLCLTLNENLEVLKLLGKKVSCQNSFVHILIKNQIGINFAKYKIIKAQTLKESSLQM